MIKYSINTASGQSLGQGVGSGLDELRLEESQGISFDVPASSFLNISRDGSDLQLEAVSGETFSIVDFFESNSNIQFIFSEVSGDALAEALPNGGLLSAEVWNNLQALNNQPIFVGPEDGEKGSSLQHHLSQLEECDLFSYEFKLRESVPNDAKVEITVNDSPMSSSGWLDTTTLGEQHFGLWGTIPEHDVSIGYKIGINITLGGEKIYSETVEVQSIKRNNHAHNQLSSATNPGGVSMFQAGGGGSLSGGDLAVLASATLATVYTMQSYAGYMRIEEVIDKYGLGELDDSRKFEKGDDDSDKNKNKKKGEDEESMQEVEEEEEESLSPIDVLVLQEAREIIIKNRNFEAAEFSSIAEIQSLPPVEKTPVDFFTTAREFRDMNYFAEYNLTSGFIASSTMNALYGDDFVYLPMSSEYAYRWNYNANNTFYGGKGDDIVLGFNLRDKISGHDGNDAVYGGGLNDTLYGADGDDIVDGGGNAAFLYYENNLTDGNDTLYGGQGNDTIHGGEAGDDLLYGGTGNDTLDGGTGNDTLDGETADDVIYAEGGNDVINDASGDDISYGGDGADIYNDSTGHDTVYGDDGNDTINDAAGLDSYYGGNNSDLFNLSDDDNSDYIDGGTDANDDHVDYIETNDETNDSIVFSIDSATDATATLDTTVDTLKNIEVFSGDGGDDTFNDGTGTQTLNGENGNDLFNMNEDGGNDTLYGGEEVGDTDHIDYDDAAGAITFNVTSSTNATATGGVGTDEFYGLETFSGHNGNDIFHDGGSSGIQSYNGESGQDTFNMDDDNATDFINGGVNGTSDHVNYIDTQDQTNDNIIFNVTSQTAATATLDGVVDTFTNIGTFSGNDGADTFNDGGSSGVQSYNGESGNDTFVMANDGSADVIDGGANTTVGDTVNYTAYTGTKTIDLSTGNTTGLHGDTLSNIENVVTNTGVDTVIGNASANSISSGAGNDYLYGGAGADTLDGGADNDHLYGGTGMDTLYGNGGNDHIYITDDDVGNNLDTSGGSWYVRSVWGGAGTDTLDFSQMTSALTSTTYARDMNQEFEYFIGTNQGDDIVGDKLEVTYTDTTSNVTAYGLDGADTLWGGHSGHDIEMYGGNHADLLSAGYGTAGDDGVARLFGDAGNDKLVKANDAGIADTMYGGTGNDYIYGNAGDDKLYGADVAATDTTGADYLYGGTGIDSLYGGGGADHLYGGVENDIIDGGNGDDVIYISSASDGNFYNYGDGSFTKGLRNITGGDNHDTIEFSGFSVSVTTNDATDVEVIIGSDNDDNIDDHYGNSTFYGGVGDDWLEGDGGDDYLYGGNIAGTDTTGADKLYGGSGLDHIYGGGGDDVIHYLSWDLGTNISYSGGRTELQSMWGGDGTDTIDFSSLYSDGSAGLGGTADWANQVVSARELGGDIEVIVGSKGHDTIEVSMTGLVSQASFYGLTGNDVTYSSGDIIYGGAGNDYNTTWGNLTDYFYGDAGNDQLVQVSDTSATDYLYGGDGSDTLSGEGGTDYIYGGPDADNVGDTDNDTLYGGGGSDYLYGGSDADVLEGGNGIDYTYGGVGADTINGNTNDGVKDTSWGGDGNDVITLYYGSDVGYGGGDNDDMYGGSGETLYGDAGADEFWGGKAYGGNDKDIYYGVGTYSHTFVGGLGDDTGTGNSGIDRFWGEGNNDTFYGSSGDDSLHGGDNNDDLRGGSGIDYLYGGAHDDYIDSGTGADLSYGGAGNDYIRDSGTGGNDKMYGGNGSDTFFINHREDSYFGDAGTDYLDIYSFGGGTAGTTSVDLVNDNIKVHDNSWGNGSTYFNSIEGVFGSNTAADSIYGGNEANVFYGNGGIDTMWGGGGNDIFYMERGHDSSYGGFEGEAGRGFGEKIYGGAGLDEIRFSDYHYILYTHTNSWGGTSNWATMQLMDEIYGIEIFDFTNTGTVHITTGVFDDNNEGGKVYLKGDADSTFYMEHMADDDRYFWGYDYGRHTGADDRVTLNGTTYDRIYETGGTSYGADDTATNYYISYGTGITQIETASGNYDSLYWMYS